MSTLRVQTVSMLGEAPAGTADQLRPAPTLALMKHKHLGNCHVLLCNSTGWIRTQRKCSTTTDAKKSWGGHLKVLDRGPVKRALHEAPAPVAPDQVCSDGQRDAAL